MDFRSEKYMKYVTKFCGQNVELLKVKNKWYNTYCGLKSSAFQNSTQMALLKHTEYVYKPIHICKRIRIHKIWIKYEINFMN
jgi:hypothetical protein